MVPDGGSGVFDDGFEALTAVERGHVHRDAILSDGKAAAYTVRIVDIYSKNCCIYSENC